MLRKRHLRDIERERAPLEPGGDNKHGTHGLRRPLRCHPPPRGPTPPKKCAFLRGVFKKVCCGIPCGLLQDRCCSYQDKRQKCKTGAAVAKTKGKDGLKRRGGNCTVGSVHPLYSGCSFFAYVDEGQITHLICARLKYDLYDYFRGCFWAFSIRKRTGSRPKTPPKKVI